MKLFATFLLILLLVSCANGKERVFTGSTPAGKQVRIFLGIPLTDSIDFIRWKLVLADKNYQLTCNYGIGKPNTAGFIEGGKHILFSGPAQFEKNIYSLRHGNNLVRLAELNEDLLQFWSEANKPIVGNGGWSYTLNSLHPISSAYIRFTPALNLLVDSLVFVGRTPCNVPSVNMNKDCYKLKWKVVLIASSHTTGAGMYKIYGANWREKPLIGSWELVNMGNGEATYRLTIDELKGTIYLLSLQGILLFTDSQGKLLVGDQDFSYTLNRL